MIWLIFPCSLNMCHFVSIRSNVLYLMELTSVSLHCSCLQRLIHSTEHISAVPLIIEPSSSIMNSA